MVSFQFRDSRILIAGLVLALVLAGPGVAQAGGVAGHLGKMSEAAAASIGHSVQARGKLVVGALAVVRVVPAGVGPVSEEASAALWAHADGPLPIDDAVHTVGPADGSWPRV